MDTLRDRLSELADDAPTGGAPAAELWARGKRAQRVRAAALAVAALVVGVIGTGVGLGLAHDGDDDPDLVPARTVGFTLPIEYPSGAALPDLGDTPGPLAAVWLVPRAGGGSPEVVGLVARTGRFGTLPIDLPSDEPASADTVGAVALSPDGRRLAYPSPTVPWSDDGAPDPVVRDLVTGETFTSAFEFKTRVTALWVDAAHLFGYVAAGSDADGWLWEPGHAPLRVNPYELPYAGSDVAVASWPALTAPMDQEDGSGKCTTLNLHDVRTPESSSPARVPTLCTVLGVIGSDILVGHRNNPTDGNGTVIALRFDAADPFCPSVARRCELSVDDAGPRVVATAGAPERVTFATDLIRVALGAMGGRS
jgi:hypothetical protein